MAEIKSHGITFPDPNLANKDGLLAVGGNLEISTLIEAYSNGIFPWYSEGNPILWWSPDPRMVLFPDKLKVSKSLKQTIKSQKFVIRFDQSFRKVIESCSKVKRKGYEGTWITEEMKQAYIRLHEEGIAHSVETYFEGQLAGGLYGVSLGRTFFGESMFYLVRDTSKVALYYLVEQLKKWDFDLIDVQQSTAHMKSLGAEEIPRNDFLLILTKSLEKETIRGSWGGEI